MKRLIKQKHSSIEDEFEKLIEKQYIPVLRKKYEKNLQFLEKYPLKWSYDNVIGVPFDVTWTEMKQLHNFGFCEGSVIGSLITWIYLRPDVTTDFYSGILTSKKIVSHGVLNYHFFLVK